MPGVTVGDGAIIGARAVVGRNVAPYAVVVGNPARVVRYRFNESTVDQLLRIRWWDWPADRIARHVEASGVRNLQALIAAAGS
jgi:virginiamycin A acetyltransferase